MLTNPSRYLGTPIGLILFLHETSRLTIVCIHLFIFCAYADLPRGFCYICPQIFFYASQYSCVLWLGYNCYNKTFKCCDRTVLHCFCLQLQRVVVPGLLLKTENTARLVVRVSILSQFVFYQQMCMCCFDAGFVIHFFPYLIKVMLHTLWTTALYKSFTFF